MNLIKFIVLFFLFLFATFVNATPVTSNVKVIYYSFPDGQKAKADEFISKYQNISMCINVAIAGKGLLIIKTSIDVLIINKMISI